MVLFDRRDVSRSQSSHTCGVLSRFLILCVFGVERLFGVKRPSGGGQTVPSALRWVGAFPWLAAREVILHSTEIPLEVPMLSGGLSDLSNLPLCRSGRWLASTRTRLSGSASASSERCLLRLRARHTHSSGRSLRPLDPPPSSRLIAQRTRARFYPQHWLASVSFESSSSSISA